jgi:hypothetical protein
MTAADCYLIDLLIYMIDDPIFQSKVMMRGIQIPDGCY